MYPQDLLYRRTRSLANYESANKKLETAKTKGKGVHDAEAHQQTCKEKFDKLSEVGKEGVMDVQSVIDFQFHHFFFPDV